MKKLFLRVLILLLCSAPLSVFAYPFGGQIGTIVYCFNNAIYAGVGPPNGGPFIWTPSTRTYQFGPPRYVGQWVLGLAAPPYYCLVTPDGIIIWSGILMTMVGSSGVAAPGLSGGSGDGAGSPGGISSPGSTGTGGTGSGTSSGLSHVLISEVYEKPDASHGGKSENGWIEIYNPTSIAADLSGWRLESSTTAATIAAKTLLDPGQFMIFAGTSAVKDLWNLPSSARVIVLPAFFKGSDTFGDHIIIRDSANTKLDSVSWGSDVTAFSPASPQWSIGNSLLRKSLSLDSDSSSDWTTAPSPTPGK